MREQRAACRPRGYVGVSGPGSGVAENLLDLAEEVGRRLAEQDFAVVTGGLGGVMEAASRGAAYAGGLTVGLLPGSERGEANPYVGIAVPTGMGEMRNALLVRTCDALVSVGGSWGTLSEVALACRTGVPVYALAGWEPPDDDPVPVASAEEAVLRVAARLGGQGMGR